MPPSDGYSKVISEARETDGYVQQSVRVLCNPCISKQVEIEWEIRNVSEESIEVYALEWPKNYFDRGLTYPHHFDVEDSEGNEIEFNIWRNFGSQDPDFDESCFKKEYRDAYFVPLKPGETYVFKTNLSQTYWFEPGEYRVRYTGPFDRRWYTEWVEFKVEGYDTFIGYVIGNDTEKEEESDSCKEIAKESAIAELESRNISKNDYSFKGEYLVADKLETRRAINRLLGSLCLNSIAPPYWAINLVLLPTGKREICITENPDKLKEDFQWWEEVIEVDEGDSKIEMYCKIVNEKNSYAKMDRKELSSYFDAKGVILWNYREELTRNPDFIHALLVNGYYVRIAYHNDDLTASFLDRLMID